MLNLENLHIYNPSDINQHRVKVPQVVKNMTNYTTAIPYFMLILIWDRILSSYTAGKYVGEFSEVLKTDRDYFVEKRGIYLNKVTRFSIHQSYFSQVLDQCSALSGSSVIKNFSKFVLELPETIEYVENNEVKKITWAKIYRPENKSLVNIDLTEEGVRLIDSPKLVCSLKKLFFLRTVKEQKLYLHLLDHTKNETPVTLTELKNTLNLKPEQLRYNYQEFYHKVLTPLMKKIKYSDFKYKELTIDIASLREQKAVLSLEELCKLKHFKTKKNYNKTISLTEFAGSASEPKLLPKLKIKPEVKHTPIYWAVKYGDTMALSRGRYYSMDKNDKNFMDSIKRGEASLGQKFASNLKFIRKELQKEVTKRKNKRKIREEKRKKYGKKTLLQRLQKKSFTQLVHYYINVNLDGQWWDSMIGRRETVVKKVEETVRNRLFKGNQFEGENFILWTITNFSTLQNLYPEIGKIWDPYAVESLLLQHLTGRKPVVTRVLPESPASLLTGLFFQDLQNIEKSCLLHLREE